MWENRPTSADRACSSTRSSKVPPLVAIAMVLSVLASGCGGSTAGTQPAADAGIAVPASFDALPHYPNSTPAGTLTRRGSSTTRSYRADTVTPLEVLDYYRIHLGGWQMVDSPHLVGEGPRAPARATWTKDGASLLVSSERAPRLGNSPETVQYSLVLTTS